MDINARLEKLERENRRMKKISIVAAVVLSCLILGGQATTKKVVEANEFVLKDTDGKVRSRLSMEIGTRPTLSFYDANGSIPLSLAGGDEPFVVLSRVGTQESVQLGANQAFTGVGIYEKNIRAGLSVQKGSPGLELYDAEGKARTTIETSEDRSSIDLSNPGNTAISSMWAGSEKSGGSGVAVTETAGTFRVILNGNIFGPQLALEDKQGYSTEIGKSDLVLTKTGRKEQTPAASIVLFDKDKKVLWSAP